MDNPALIEKFDAWSRALFPPAAGRAHVARLPGAAEALLAWALARAGQAPVVLVADGPHSLEVRHADLATLAPADGWLLSYPPRETPAGERDRQGLEQTGRRLDVLCRLAAGPPAAPCVLTTCVQALMQKTFDPAALRGAMQEIAVGREQDPCRLMHGLAERGYEGAAEVERPGQAAIKGGLVDVWSPQAPWPWRIEFFGDRVESLRTFDPATQRSRDRLERVDLFPLDERHASDRGAGVDAIGLTDYLPERTHLVWSGVESIREHAALYAQNAAAAGRGGAVAAPAALNDALARRSTWRHLDIHLDEPGADESAAARPDLRPLALAVDATRERSGPDVRDAARQRLLEQCLCEWKAGHGVVFFFDTRGGLNHFREDIAPRLGAGRGWQWREGAVSEGFSSRTLGLTVVAESDLYVRRGPRRTPARRAALRPGETGPRLSSFADIEPGDLVVHVEHGLGRYLGLREIVFQSRRQEALTVEYADGAKLHVPVSHAHLLSRYIGMSRQRAKLHRLGGRRWKKEKDSARHAIEDMAAQLLETQARRNARQGHAFGSDHPWQREFEASFPYRETPDQDRAIAEVKADMESARPMDRLLCGDAGYGKTEVAVRAAFKAATEGRQTAVLAPTTVLAQQHFEVFRARMAAYPLRVDMLSRFCSARQQSQTLAGLAEGATDVVVGTHALLQPGVRFKELGLVVIDEEQRFGVRHKEWFKNLRSQVDMLTLSATPIPRTLYMSLTGVRDMSLIQTPPSERLAVKTHVAPNQDETVRAAILRELNREGQAYYLHNRVRTIDRVRSRLQKLVPEARLGVAHGQMPAGELAATMRRFVEMEFDVLICTTIIESGLDIPSVNTILIDRADRFGLSDLYQLRGRVGRSRHQAYAYMLLPPQGQVDSDARQRMRAVKEHADLGEGFKLAVRDLEIRGAGNVLGARQSGHIAAIGFELYCQMLRRTVARLNQEPAPPVIDAELKLDCVSLGPDVARPDGAAFLPQDYIEDEKLRVQAHRRIAEAARETELTDLAGEWTDRFGPVPAPVRRLLKIAAIRILASEQGITAVETRARKLVLARGRDYVKRDGRFPRLRAVAADAKLDEIADLIRSWPPLRARSGE